jgi:hypothetical protein
MVQVEVGAGHFSFLYLVVFHCIVMSAADFSPLPTCSPYHPQAVEDIEVVEAFRGEAETPKMETGFALIRKYLIYFGRSRG